MPKVTLDKIAPNFSLDDYTSQKISLSGFRGQKNVLLVFNRGFA